MGLRDRIEAGVARARMSISPAVVTGPLALRRSLPSRVIDPIERRLGFTADPGALPPVPHGEHRLLVGPSNYAAQGNAWARAGERVAGVGSTSFMVHNPYGFPVDAVVPPRAFLSSAWGRAMEEHVTTHFSHVLFEAARPVLGLRHGLDAAGDVRNLEGAGIQVAMVAHGTDVRDVADHARRFGYSPYQNYSRWRNIARLAAHNRELLGRLAGEGRPLFVSTPDLLVEFPEAIWLPVVVDPQEWLSQAPPLSIDRRPVVVHAPTVAAVKGTEGAHPELERLATDGVIDYRPLRGLSRSAFCAELRRADIIVDQFGLGSYGVTAVEGMAAGRLVIGRVDPVRQTVLEGTGLGLPVVESAPEHLGLTIRRLLADTEESQHQARLGQEYALALHDGRRAAELLGSFLGQTGHKP